MNDANNAGTGAPCEFCGTYPNPNDPPCATLEQAYARTEVRPFGCPWFSDDARKQFPPSPEPSAALREAIAPSIQRFKDRIGKYVIQLNATGQADVALLLWRDSDALLTAILAVRLDEAAIQKDEREPTSEMLLAGARSIGNSMGADNFMVRAKSCWDAMQAARMGTMEPRPAIRNGGKQP